MALKSSLSILIPAYNEAQTFRQVYLDIKAELLKLGVDWEIICCDDGSQDRTKEIIMGIVKEDPKVRMMSHAHNQGIARTFEDLYAMASKELVMLLPADGQWPPDSIPKALNALGTHAVVIAARRHKHYTVFRLVNSWAFNTLVRCCFGIELYDIGSVKLWRRNVLQGIKVQATSLFNEAERLIKAHRAGYTMGVIYVEHRPRIAGKAQGAKLSNIITTFCDVFKFYGASMPNKGH